MTALKATDIMSAPVHVVRRDTDLIAAATLLAENGIAGAPVTDPAGRIVGVISEKDFLRRMGAGRSGSFMQVVARCLLWSLGPQQPGQTLATVRAVRFYRQEGQQGSSLGRLETGGWLSVQCGLKATKQRQR